MIQYRIAIKLLDNAKKSREKYKGIKDKIKTVVPNYQNRAKPLKGGRSRLQTPKSINSRESRRTRNKQLLNLMISNKGPNTKESANNFQTIIEKLKPNSSRKRRRDSVSSNASKFQLKSFNILERLQEERYEEFLKWEMEKVYCTITNSKLATTSRGYKKMTKNMLQKYVVERLKDVNNDINSWSFLTQAIVDQVFKYKQHMKVQDSDTRPTLSFQDFKKMFDRLMQFNEKDAKKLCFEIFTYVKDPILEREANEAIKRAQLMQPNEQDIANNLAGGSTQFNRK